MCLAALPALLRFALSLSRRPSVRKLGYRTDGERVEFWVLIDKEDPEEREAMFRVLQEHEKGVPHNLWFDLHVVPLSEVRESNLPPLETLVER